MTYTPKHALHSESDFVVSPAAFSHNLQGEGRAFSRGESPATAAVAGNTSGAVPTAAAAVAGNTSSAAPAARAAFAGSPSKAAFARTSGSTTSASYHATNPSYHATNPSRRATNPSRRALLAGGAAAFLAGALATKPALAHAVEGNVASQEELAQLAYELADLSYDVEGLEQNVTSLSENAGALATRLTQAEQSLDSFEDISTRFPVGNSDIADNSIGMGKLTDQAKSDIIGGISVRYFNNREDGANNTGLICPAQGELAGFYVPELTLLVINRYYKPYGMADGSWLSGETKFRLPTYVPRVTENVTLAPLGIADFAEDGAYLDWHGFGVNSGGYVGGIGSSGEDEGRVLVGNIVAFLRPYIAVE